MSLQNYTKVKCSCATCYTEAIKEITIHAESKFTLKKYKIWINVCNFHYSKEKEAGNIIDEIKNYRSTDDLGMNILKTNEVDKT